MCIRDRCGIAVAVNISQFMCLGRFSAVTFQVCPGTCCGACAPSPCAHMPAVTPPHGMPVVLLVPRVKVQGAPADVRPAVQVTGHAKTVMVLLGSSLFLHEDMSARQVLGMSLAVVGMIAYGYFSAQGAKPGPTIAMAGTGSLKVPLTRAASGH